MKKCVIVCMAGLALGVAPLRMAAQHSMGDAIQRYAEERTGADYFMSYLRTWPDSTVRGGRLYSQGYYFGIPEKKLGLLLDPIRRAYEADRSSAYVSFEKDLRSATKDKMDVAYGENMEFSVSFGDRPGCCCLVLAVRDTLNEGKRYVYGIEWYADPDKRKHVLGSMFVIHGADPQLFVDRQATALVPTVAQLEALEKLASMPPERLAGLDAETRRDIGDIAELSRVMLKNASANGGVKDTIVTEDDFLDRFEKLRYAYIKAVKGGDKSMVPVGLARKVLDLCSRYAGVVSESLRQNALTAGLVEMAQASKDQYLMFLFDEAILRLDKD